MNLCSGFFSPVLTLVVAVMSLCPEINPVIHATDRTSAIKFEHAVVFGTPVTGPLGKVVGVRIPLKRAGRLFLLEGTIDKVIGNFILDTGAAGLVLNKTYFRNFISLDDVEGGGVTGSTGQVNRATAKHLQVADLGYDNISADVTPLGHLENRRGVKILGLFGISMMQNLQVIIDLRNNALQLFKLDRNGNTLNPDFQKVRFDVVQKVEEFRNILFVKASIGGKMLDFCLDTGAESNVMSLDLPKKAMNTVNVTRRSGLRGAGSMESEVLYGNMTDFVLGARQFSPMETILCSLSEMSAKYEYPIDGMLGYDFFSKGRIFINMAKNEMGICLNKEEKP